MSEQSEYAGWKSVYLTPFMDYARDMFGWLKDRQLDVAVIPFQFGGFIGWKVVASPADYDKAVAAVTEIRATSKRSL